MITSVERKDKEGIINASLRVLGYNVTSVDVEKILNCIDYVREHPAEATLKDILKLGLLVDDLFTE
jgi:hypothetical protein